MTRRDGRCWPRCCRIGDICTGERQLRTEVARRSSLRISSSTMSNRLSVSLDAKKGPVRDHLREVYSRILEGLADVIREAQLLGEIDAGEGRRATDI